MNLETFAHRVLFGESLDEKLVRPDFDAFGRALSQDAPIRAIEPPSTPGRPASLSLGTPGGSRRKKTRFPDLAELHHAHVRGEVLHFFANHELLALELMALVLLRFPDAPASFRLGIARTMNEEQGHLRLYLQRMGELGVTLGDLPVNRYFWDVLREMRSPLDFVTQMSLTFEQANLDFSLFYRDAIAKTGDAETTRVLDQVYREEIGHVKHGLEWFNRWRKDGAADDESDWQAYKRLLPPPLTPRRAKGEIFSHEARKLAGFSDVFISELELFSGAKGRPPVLWLYNPFCDAEIARGKSGFSPKAKHQALMRDLEHLPMFLASPQDTVLVSERPSLAWLETIKKSGFDLPDWASPLPRALSEPKFGGFEPWGWSPETFSFFEPLKDRLIPISGGNAEWCASLFAHSRFSETALSPLFSKSWLQEFLRGWGSKQLADGIDTPGPIGSVARHWEEAEKAIVELLNDAGQAVVKAPWSTSGNGVRRIRSRSELEGALGGWIKNTISEQGSIVVEPWLSKIHDLSIQFEVASEQTRILEFRKFLTGKQFEYRGTLLGPLRESFDAESLCLLQRCLPGWKELIRDLSATLRERGYRGNVGMDAMIYRDGSGALRLRPCVEINPRWTMGRIALALEEKILPGIPAAWLFIPIRELAKQDKSALEFTCEISARFPLQIAKKTSPRIQSGVIATQDPARAREVLTLLFVGEKAFSEGLALIETSTCSAGSTSLA